MDSYRKKPVVVNATQYLWTPKEVERLIVLGIKVEPSGLWDPPDNATLKMWVEKSQMWADLEDGDWVIWETDGIGVYPCKRDIFVNTYEPHANFPIETIASAGDQMGEAIRNMARHAAESEYVDRRGWTDRQWIDDARKLMNDIDGSIMSLKNGHVMALIRFYEGVVRSEVAIPDWQKWLLGEARALLGNADLPHDECQVEAWRQARIKWVQEYNRNAHISD